MSFLLASSPSRGADSVPLIDQPLLPASVAPGSSGFTLTVNGTGFVSGSQVEWNGMGLVTTYVSGSELTATIPAGDVAVAGMAYVTVKQPGGAQSSAVDFEIAKTVPYLAISPYDYSYAGVNNSGISIVAADFNGDGLLDLAVLDTPANSFVVFLGTTTGFKPDLTQALPGAAGFIIAGDFNHDGRADVAASGTGALYLFPGNGDGTFSPVITDAWHGSAGRLATGDFDGDGKLDFATVNYSTGSVSVLINGTATDYAVANSPAGIATGDFNGDGKLDLAVSTVNPDGGGAISMLLGNGDGTFVRGADASSAYYLYSITTGDFNGDGKLDVVSVALGGVGQADGLSVYLGNGDGTFLAPAHYNTNYGASDVVTGDFNNDSILDLAVSQSANSSVGVFLGNGDGTFQAMAQFTDPVYQAAAGLATGDFNRDGALDLAAGAAFGAGDVTVFLQDRGPVAALSPSALNFPRLLAGTTSSRQQVTLTNAGFTGLKVFNISASANFLASSDCPASLAPLASCKIDVAERPEQAGLLSGELSITDNAPQNPQSAYLTGQGTFLSISPASLDFGSVPVGTVSQPQTLTISSVATTVLTTTVSIAGTASEWPFTENCATIPPKGSCTVSVSFAPQLTGSAAASLRVNGGASLAAATVQGTGTSGP